MATAIRNCATPREASRTQRPSAVRSLVFAIRLEAGGECHESTPFAVATSWHHGNMGITDERLDDFIGRWERIFAERLSREEARPIAARLINFYRLIVRPVPEAAARAGDGRTSLQGV